MSNKANWTDSAAGRIFSYAVDWNEGRKKWHDEDVASIIRHEMTASATPSNKLAIRLLIECYNSIHRHSWEEGKTEGEVMDDVCAFLWNLGLQPGLPEHEDAVKTFMEAK